LNKDRRTQFEELMLPHLNAAYPLARWMMRHPDEAEDAVQDAYLRALEHFDGYQGDGEKSWLLMIVRNVCLTRLKRSRQSAKVVFIDDVVGQAEQAMAQNSSDRTLQSRAQRGTSRASPAADELSRGPRAPRVRRAEPPGDCPHHWHPDWHGDVPAGACPVDSGERTWCLGNEGNAWQKGDFTKKPKALTKVIAYHKRQHHG
jgi:RNA polymerase sigma factor (sigma-70 family)